MKDNQAPKIDNIKELIVNIKKTFGSGSVMLLGDKEDLDIDSISTGSLSLDFALGVNGYPKGRIIEIYGPESSGKTTLTLHAIAECQKAGGICAFIDSEHALDPVYAKNIGVNVDSLILSQPDFGEQALSIAEALVKEKVQMIVIDSVAALVPKAEIDGDLEDQSPALQARMMSKSLRKLAGLVSKFGCIIIFTNQLRSKICSYGNPETTTGGNALKFYSSIRIDIRSGEKILNNGSPYGMYSKIKVVKNKISSPFKTTEIPIIYGKGISNLMETISLGCKLGIFTSSGSWYSYNNVKIGQGINSIKTFLLNNNDILNEIRKLILNNSKI